MPLRFRVDSKFNFPAAIPQPGGGSKDLDPSDTRLTQAVARRDELGPAARDAIVAGYDQTVVGPRLAELLRSARHGAYTPA